MFHDSKYEWLSAMEWMFVSLQNSYVEALSSKHWWYLETEKKRKKERNRALYLRICKPGLEELKNQWRGILLEEAGDFSVRINNYLLTHFICLVLNSWFMFIVLSKSHTHTKSLNNEKCKDIFTFLEKLKLRKVKELVQGLYSK